MGFEIINEGKTLRKTEDTDKVDLQAAKQKIEDRISAKTIQLNKDGDRKLQPLNDLLEEVNEQLSQF